MVSGAWGITVQEEEELGKEFMEQVNKQYKLIKDPYIDNYLNEIGQKLLKQFPPQPFTFHFYMVDQEVYNAFAGPAAHVFVNSGLFAAMDNESELAGILGHEISHVACRHISKSIEQSGKINIGTMAGVLAGILLGATGSGSASEAMVIGSLAAGQSVVLAHSREDEKEADEMGVKALIGAGYPVQGLITMLKKIKERDWYGDEVPSYLQTHPGVDERIVYLSRYIDYSDKAQQEAKQKPELEFEQAHARVMALYSDKDKAAAWFADLAKKQPDSFLPDYGLGLLALRENRLEDAEGYFKKALEKRAFDPLILADLGKSYYMNGEYPAARGVLESAAKMDAKNLEGRLYLGQTLIALNDYSEAQNTFERLNADAPDYSMAVYYLGETYNKQGRTAEAHYYLGLYYLQTEDFQKASFNLKRAREEANDDGLRKKIDAALKKAEEKQKEGQKKKKKEQEENKGEGSQQFGFWIENPYSVTDYQNAKTAW